MWGVDMLNEEKIRLMTRLAIYENREGKKAKRIAKYFRGDYVSWNVIKAGLSVTIAYLILVALWAVYKIEILLETLTALNIMEVAQGILLRYLGVLGIFIIISYIIYTIRYEKAKKSLKRFYKNLRKLEQVGLEGTRMLDETGGIRP